MKKKGISNIQIFFSIISLVLFFVFACSGKGGSSKNKKNSDATWNKKFGGIKWERGNSIQQTSDGGYILFGDTNSFGNGENDLYLVRTDASGNEIWSKTFGGAKQDYGYSVQQTTDAGYILLGTTDSFGSGSTDIYLVKTDSSGNEIWSKTFDGTKEDYGYSVQQTTDAGYIILGTTNSFDSSYSKIYLVKIDSSGNEIWSKRFGEDNYNSKGKSVEQTKDGGYILLGTAKGDSQFMSWDVDDIYLVKTDPDGNKLWSKKFGSDDWETSESVQQTSDGGYILCGGTARESTCYIVKTNSEGNEVWHKELNKLYYTRGYSIRQISDGGFIVVGETFDVKYDNSISGHSYIYLNRIDSSGKEVWNKMLGEDQEKNVYGKSIQQTKDGGFVILGSIFVGGSTNNWDMYLVKINDE